MFAKRNIVLFSCMISILVPVSFSQPKLTPQDDVANAWNDFLHYALIGRLDLSQASGQKLIDLNPDPLKLLTLSEENAKGYRLLLKMYSNSKELKQVSGMILEIIEEGRFIRRIDPKIITQEIRRLSTTIRGRITAETRLKNAGEYAIPYMLDALADPDRKNEFANITKALPKIGRDAVRPLVAALQTNNIAVKAEVIRALGDIGYPQPLGYLKYVAENDSSTQLRHLAFEAIDKIDSNATKLGAAEILFQLGESYYDHSESLAPGPDYSFANVWFWDENSIRLLRQEVDKAYFHELMAMRSCEWALKDDKNMPKAIALWIAAFFKAEAANLPMPAYFGSAHADAMTYATTAGPGYLHQALERAINDNDAYVALGVVEALATNAGEKSLLYRIGTNQPLVEALSFNDTAVKYSAAIAIGLAGPTDDFTASTLIVENLADAVGKTPGSLNDELAEIYSIRAVKTMLHLAVTRNRIVDLALAQPALIKATMSKNNQMQILAGRVLARLSSPDAQRAVADMALAIQNKSDVRISAFNSLAVSAKLNAKLLDADQIDAIYLLIGSDQTAPNLRAAAAAAYGALNLPSEKVKDLILDQAQS